MLSVTGAIFNRAESLLSPPIGERNRKPTHVPRTSKKLIANRESPNAKNSGWSGPFSFSMRSTRGESPRLLEHRPRPRIPDWPPRPGPSRARKSRFQYSVFGRGMCDATENPAPQRRLPTISIRNGFLCVCVCGGSGAFRNNPKRDAGALVSRPILFRRRREI